MGRIHLSYKMCLLGSLLVLLSAIQLLSPCNANGIEGHFTEKQAFIQSIFSEAPTKSNISLDQNGEYKKKKVLFSINSGCPYKPCKSNQTEGGFVVTIANLTVKETPSRATENHWMWSVIGHPTIQAAITNPGNVLTVDWPKIFGSKLGSLWKAIRYRELPYYSSAVMLTKLIEFNDTSKTARLTDQEPKDIKVYDLIHFNWRRNLVNADNRSVAIELLGENFKANNSQELSGSINLTLSAYAHDGYGHWLPHLAHDTRTNQFDIQLQQLKSNSGFKASRFALEMAIVSDCTEDDECKNKNITQQKATNLDDEHTPGIFSTDELLIPGINKSLKSFIQWRPIVYNTMRRELAQSTGVTMSNATHVQNAARLYNHTLLYALYGPDLDNILVSAINVTFGRKGDGVYDRTKYQAWTFIFGTGDPIRNGLSGVIILAITLMVGITTLVSLTAIIICAAKKFGFGRRNVASETGPLRTVAGSESRDNQYQPLTDEQQNAESSALDGFVNRWIRWYTAPANRI